MMVYAFNQFGGGDAQRWLAARGDGTAAVPYVPLFGYGDTPSLDAFGRLRVSTPEYVFDAQQTYDLQPLLFEQITAESGASIAHDATNRCATLTFASTPIGGKAIMQSFEHFRYQPGRSHLAFITFNFNGGAANVLKFAGLSAGATNGIELQLSGTAPRVALYSDTTVGDQTVAQADWDDPLDGTGPSGVTVDWTKTQILAIDLQALYVGRVRLALNIGGVLVPFCSIDNANVQANPYIQTANLPVRVGMTSTGTVSTTMQFVCSSVISEGGSLDPQGFEQSIVVAGTAGNDARAHILSIRPKLLFNSIGNRSKLILDSIDAMITSGSNPVTLEVALGQAISGTTTFADVNASYSAVEYNSAGTLSGNPAIVLATTLVSATSSGRPPAVKPLGVRYPLTLDAAGAARALGTLSILATGHTGTSPIRVALNWREIR